jgi:hypothetical protein
MVYTLKELHRPMMWVLLIVAVVSSFYNILLAISVCLLIFVLCEEINLDEVKDGRRPK